MLESKMRGDFRLTSWKTDKILNGDSKKNKKS